MGCSIAVSCHVKARNRCECTCALSNSVCVCVYLCETCSNIEMPIEVSAFNIYTYEKWQKLTYCEDKPMKLETRSNTFSTEVIDQLNKKELPFPLSQVQVNHQ